MCRQARSPVSQYNFPHRRRALLNCLLYHFPHPGLFIHKLVQLPHEGIRASRNRLPTLEPQQLQVSTHDPRPVEIHRDMRDAVDDKDVLAQVEL